MALAPSKLRKKSLYLSPALEEPQRIFSIPNLSCSDLLGLASLVIICAVRALCINASSEVVAAVKEVEPFARNGEVEHGAAVVKKLFKVGLAC